MLAACLGLAGSPRVAMAAEDDPLAGVEVETVVGWSATATPAPGRWTPVTTTITSDRLVSGVLEVASQTARGEQVHEVPVEVSGGAVKRYRHLAPPAFGHVVRLVDGDASSRPTRVGLQGGGATPLVVGLLADELPPDRPPVTLDAFDLTGQWVAVPPVWLDHGPRALDGVDTLVVRAEALDGLDNDTARTLRLAVTDGLRLVVVSDGAPVTDTTPTLGVAPATVTDEGAGVTASPVAHARLDGTTPVAATLPLGRGRVTVASGGLGAAVPHVALRAGGSSPSGEGPSIRQVDASRNALEGAVGGLPRVAWVAGFVLLFVLAVGPLNGAVLHRLGRRELAWVTIPVITGVFVLGAFATSRSFGDTAGVSGRVAWWWGDDGQELVVAAARTPSGGDVDVTLPGDGWDVVASGDGAATRVVRGTDGVTASASVDGFQSSTLVGWRTLDDAAPMTVDATLDGDVLVVEVANTSSRMLTDVELHAATLARDLDDLAPGATTTVEVDTGGQLPVRDPWDDGVDRDLDGVPVQPDALLDVARWGPLAGDPGVVWVSASDGAQDTGARALGRATGTVASAVVVGTAPEVVGDVVSPFAVQRDAIAVGFGELWQPSPLAVEGQGTAVVRFALPAGTDDVTALVASLDRGRFEGLTGGGEGGLQTVCEAIEEVDEDGELVVVGEECEEVPAGVGAPPVEAFPACPDDAVSCEFGSDTWTICFEGGECEEGGRGDRLPRDETDDEPQGGDEPGGAVEDLDGPIDFEVHDHELGRWTSFEGAVAAGDAVDRLVDHDGVVLLRVRGELFPLDLSGRGLGARLAGGGS